MPICVYWEFFDKIRYYVNENGRWSCGENLGTSVDKTVQKCVNHRYKPGDDRWITRCKM